MSAEIIIDSDELKREAENIETALEEAEGVVRNIEGLISESSRYWEGIAYEGHKQIWNPVNEQLNAVLAKLKKHPENLRKTAADIEDVLEAAKTDVAALSTNVIL